MNQSSTTQKFSSYTGEMRRFIFNRLQQTDNQKTLYTLRLISKSEQEIVEKKIQTAKINFCDIAKFATSKFSARIKFLEVCFRIWQDSFECFKYLSTTYLPYAQNIDAKVFPSFHEDNDWADIGLDKDEIDLDMRELLTFRRLHIVNYSKLYTIQINGKYNVQILDCEFIGISVYCKGNANVYVTGSKFIKGKNGLVIDECDSVYIDEITSDNCEFFGLNVYSVKEIVNITNVRVISCAGTGIFIGKNVANFKLSNTIIKDCKYGIIVVAQCCGEIQKTNIEGCGQVGICVFFGAIVQYAALEYKHNKQDVMIRDNSQFLQLENIS